MKRTLEKTQTKRKQIYVPDDIIDRIDIEALPDYPTRPEFMAEAIRLLTDKLMNQRSIVYSTSKIKTENPMDMEGLIYDEMRPYLSGLKQRLSEYDSDEATPITASLTEHQLMEIDHFIRIDGPIKNLQDYCRIAIVLRLDDRRFARESRDI